MSSALQKMHGQNQSEDNATNALLRRGSGKNFGFLECYVHISRYGPDFKLKYGL